MKPAAYLCLWGWRERQLLYLAQANGHHYGMGVPNKPHADTVLVTCKFIQARRREQLQAVRDQGRGWQVKIEGSLPEIPGDRSYYGNSLGKIRKMAEWVTGNEWTEYDFIHTYEAPGEKFGEWFPAWLDEFEDFSESDLELIHQRRPTLSDLVN